MHGRQKFGPLVVAVLAALFGATPASAQTCAPQDIFAVMDATGARLRELNAEAQPRLRAKLRDLAQKRGWSDGDLEVRGREVLDDVETRNLDERAADLFSNLDRIAEEDKADNVCERLQQARATAKELIAVTGQRTAHAIGRIDAQLNPPPAAASPPAAATPVAAVPPSPTAPSKEAAVKQAAAQPPPAQVRPKSPASAWETQTVPQPPVVASAPPATDPGSIGYAPEEIRAAGRGIFGNLSAGLASVIDLAFQKYGRPSGYVLGDEGGAAFFAGLRYGEGRLVTKLGGDRKVYWQGPSAGFDFGLAGSRVMFLVYNIDDHPEIFQRFSGIDGSAYVVGGVGITFLKRGKIILAPIRTGLGLRVGANVGYLKFTPAASFNPF